MALNQKYQSTPVAIVSFDFIDVSEGAGFINYNASSSSVETTATYFLTRTTNPSDEVYTFGNSGNTGAAVERFDVDFEITFQVPKIMAVGTAHAILAMGIGSGVTTVKTIFAKVTMFKNTTAIGSQIQSRSVTRPDGTAANTPSSGVVNVPLVITERVHFKIGDVLKFNVGIWVTQAGGTGDFALGHDPADRNDPRPAAGALKIFEDDKSTKSTFSVPFIIDA